MRASCNASVADGFVARFGTMVETMATSRHVSALPSFAPRLIGSPVKGSRQLCCRGVELKPINYQLSALRCDNRSLVGNRLACSACHGFVGTHRSGNRKNVSVQIGCASKKPLVTDEV